MDGHDPKCATFRALPTGIGISLACAAILLLAGLAYAMKTFVQYKRETSED